MVLDKRVEAEIDALLARDEGASVVDTLLAMPAMGVADDSQAAWEKLLHDRLQERLARKMREFLEEPAQKGSRSAA